MSRTRTRKNQEHSTSSDKLSLTCPTKWGELTQEQLRYVLHLIGSEMYSSVEIRTLMLFRFCDIKVERKLRNGSWGCSIREDGKKRYFYLQSWQVQSMIGQLMFVEKPEDMDIRLEYVQGYKAIDELLRGLIFKDYLNLEALYQGWILSKQKEKINKMAAILYRDGAGNLADGIVLTPAEITGVLFWYYHIKMEFSQRFPHFFKPVQGTPGYNMRDAINAQIRALTDGDVTKNEAVKNLDCHQCLAELDAKAREAEEIKAQYGKK
jgi:hypothetical protein